MSPFGDPPPAAEEELGVLLAHFVHLGLASSELPVRQAAKRVADLMTELILRES